MFRGWDKRLKNSSVNTLPLCKNARNVYGIFLSIKRLISNTFEVLSPTTKGRLPFHLSIACFCNNSGDNVSRKIRWDSPSPRARFTFASASLIAFRSEPDETFAPATVSYAFNLGWEGQAELVLSDNQKLIVKLERDRFDRLDLYPKKEVYIKPLKTRVFSAVA